MAKSTTGWLVLLLAVQLCACKKPAPGQAVTAAKAPTQPAPPCESCHPDQAKAHAHSRKARASGPVRAGLLPGPTTAAAQVDHPASGMRYRVRWLGDRLEQLELAIPTLRQPEGQVIQARRADFVVGSGFKTRSYLYLAEDRAWQLPLTWYARTNRWEMSPGYGGEDQFRFQRPITRRCLACHMDPVPPEEGGEDLFPATLPGGGIGCIRCHGDAEAHSSHHASAPGTASKPSDPVSRSVKLDRLRLLDLCDSCHLEGVARVYRTGMGPDTFQPGDRLADSVRIYVRQDRGVRTFGNASHSQRLRLSRCFQSSEMSCLSCHMAHGDTPRDPAHFRRACLSCHDPGRAADAHCSRPEHGGADADCVACHMPRALSTDIPHAATIDHFIRRRPEDTSAQEPPEALVEVGREQEPGPQQANELLDLGKAGLEAHTQSGLPGFLGQALASLRRAAALKPDNGAIQQTLATALERNGQLDEAIQAYRNALLRGQDEPALRWSLGTLLMRVQRPADALPYLEQAARSLPMALNNLALCLRAMGATERAEQSLLRAVAELPDELHPAYSLGNLYLDQQRPREAVAVLQRLTTRYPRFFEGYYSLGVARLRSGEPKRAEDAFLRAQELRPDSEAVAQGLRAIEAKRGEQAPSVQEARPQGP